MLSIFNLFIIILPFFIVSSGLSQELQSTGQIEGHIVDSDTRDVLPGVNVVLLHTLNGAASDTSGRYYIPNLKAGSYSLEFSYIGYNTMIKTDVIVRPGRITTMDIDMHSSLLSSEAISVSAGYFANTEADQVSTINFSAEEIRRSPGSTGDVSRIVMSLPSIAKVNDQSNSLIVRGGSPTENGFYVDNIEIPNINHFPTQGSSGGPIGLLNVDYLKDVNFYSGGFSPAYGDRLSSIMDISFREGTRQQFEGQLDLNFAGFGGAFEGPLNGENGSWMFSVKRSYLDLIIKMVDLGTSIAPVYGDLQGKVVYDVNPENQLSLLTIIGDDHSKSTQKVAQENEMTAFGKQNYLEATTGLNWRKIWKETGYSNTSLSYTSQRYDNISNETGSGILLRTNDLHEQSIKLRNVNHIKLDDSAYLDFGFEGKWYRDNYNSFYAAYSDILGNETEELFINKTLKSLILAAYASVQFKISENVLLSGGVRTDYYKFSNSMTFSPRASVSYKINQTFTLNASYGLYYQELSHVLLSQLKSNVKINTPKAVHTIIGLDKMIFDDTRLLLEFYNKDYSDFPVDPAQPNLFLADELYYNGFENFLNHPNIAFTGEANSHGAELTVQKKMARDFYGLVATSWFKSQYMTASGRWKDRVYDNRFTFSIEGGYKPNNVWEFSLRWLYAGGAPYTPFDIQVSTMLNRAVLEKSHINQKRYPDYHSLNVRFDRRFHFSQSNLVFYLSVWNAYDRKNIATYFWNQKENRQDVIYQWRMLPIFGLEYEF